MDDLENNLRLVFCRAAGPAPEHGGRRPPFAGGWRLDLRLQLLRLGSGRPATERPGQERDRPQGLPEERLGSRLLGPAQEGRLHPGGGRDRPGEDAGEEAPQGGQSRGGESFHLRPMVPS